MLLSIKYIELLFLLYSSLCFGVLLFSSANSVKLCYKWFAFSCMKQCIDRYVNTSRLVVIYLVETFMV